jgi:hypothetical protein
VDIPNNCATIDDSTGFMLHSLPASGSSYAVQAQTVSGTDAAFVPISTRTLIPDGL